MVQYQIASTGTYLGVDIGPGGVSDFWVKASRKYLERARLWGAAGFGLQLATLAYSVYVLPVLSYLAQFKVPDAIALKAEEEALRAMVPGPFQWCFKDDMHHFKEYYRQSRSFPRLSHMGLSARCRMTTFENCASGGLKMRERFAAIGRDAEYSDQCLGRQRVWASWYKTGIIQDMTNSLTELQQKGLSLTYLEDKAVGPSDDETNFGSRSNTYAGIYKKRSGGDWIAESGLILLVACTPNLHGGTSLACPALLPVGWYAPWAV